MKAVKCKVTTVLGQIRVYFGDDYVRLTVSQANDLSVLLSEAADAAGMVPMSCDGPCETLRAWCPECDREQEHIRISEFVIECRECHELSESP